MNNEKANFIAVATLYQKARPSVPVKIIRFLKEKMTSNGKAWDCATVMVKQQSN